MRDRIEVRFKVCVNHVDLFVILRSFSLFIPELFRQTD